MIRFLDSEVRMEYTIKTIWDADAAVWIATSEDIPGLVLESGSFDALVEKVKAAVPELLVLNAAASKDAPLFFVSERHDHAYA